MKRPICSTILLTRDFVIKRNFIMIGKNMNRPSDKILLYPELFWTVRKNGLFVLE